MRKWILLPMLLLIAAQALGQQLTGSQVSDADAERIVLLALSTQTTGTATPLQIASQNNAIARTGITGSDATLLANESDYVYQNYIMLLGEIDRGELDIVQFTTQRSQAVDSALNALQTGMSAADYAVFTSFVQTEKNHMATATDTHSGTYSAYYQNVPFAPPDDPGNTSDENSVIMDAVTVAPTCNIEMNGSSNFTGGNIWNQLPYVVQGGVGNPASTTSGPDGSMFVLDSNGATWQYQNGLGGFGQLAGSTMDAISSGIDPYLYGRKGGLLYQYSFVNSTWTQITGITGLTNVAFSPSNRAAASVGTSAYILNTINNSGGTSTWTKVGTASSTIVSVGAGQAGLGYAVTPIYYFLEQNGTLDYYQPAWGWHTATFSGPTAQVTKISASDDATLAVIDSTRKVYKGNVNLEPSSITVAFTNGWGDSISNDSVSDLYVVNSANPTVWQYLPNSTGNTNGLYIGSSGRTLMNVQNNTISNLPMFGSTNGGAKPENNDATIKTTCGGVLNTVLTWLLGAELGEATTKVYTSPPITYNNWAATALANEYCLPENSPPLCSVSTVTQRPLTPYGPPAQIAPYYNTFWVTWREKVNGTWTPWSCGPSPLYPENNAVAAPIGLGACTGPARYYNNLP